ncbi:hypothetical protein [Aeromicrobium sp. 179-A 4D2 NHS]|uniref:hypothetical protein n=1 Tax=Aeromicrobium sp. 179-A 4D2 NHS TaxID=3142375 RepID=UPI00399EF0C2
MVQTQEDRRRALAKRVCTCSDGPEDCLKNEETVTQWAPSPEKFRREPDVDKEIDFSVQRGQLTPEECWALMTSTGRVRPMLETAVVRYATVGDLRNAGIAVMHTPGRVADGLHVSLVWPAEAPLDHGTAPWPPDVTDDVNACFNEANPKGVNRND